MVDSIDAGKWKQLQIENNLLREGIKRLKLQLGIPEQQGIPFDYDFINHTLSA